MGHSTQSSTFRSRMQAVCENLVANMERQEVAKMPASLEEVQARNKKKFELCSADIPEDDQEFLLSMLNSDWEQPMVSGKLVHYCPPSCCASDEHSRKKMRVALSITLLKHFEIPLLYRWKFF